MKKTLTAVKVKDGWAIEIKIMYTENLEENVRGLIDREKLNVRAEVKDDEGNVIKIYAN